MQQMPGSRQPSARNNQPPAPPRSGPARPGRADGYHPARNNQNGTANSYQSARGAGVGARSFDSSAQSNRPGSEGYRTTRATRPGVSRSARATRPGVSRSAHPTRTGRPAVRRPAGRAAGGRRRHRDTPAQAARRFFLTFFVTLLVTVPLAALVARQIRPAAVSVADSGAQATPLPQVTASPTPAPTPAITVDLTGLHSPYAVLIQRGSGRQVGSLQPDTVIYPASMTKIMTVLLGVEQLSDLDAPVTLDPDIYPDLWADNASMAGFEPGETVTVRDLLYGSLLPSGAECSVTIANLVDGSVSAFADRMNRRAAELGMTSTHFVNPTGLHDPQHQSTVADIARLLDAALDNDTFRQLFCTREYTTSPTDAHPQGITLHSTMFSMLGDQTIPGVTLLGGKTGYTDQAGQCLASVAQCGDSEYILVTAGAPSNNHEEWMQVEDAVTGYTRLAGQLGLADPAEGS